MGRRWQRAWRTSDHNWVITSQPTAADFALRLSSRRIHERNFGRKFGQQKAIENDVFSRSYCLVAGYATTDTDIR